MMATIPYTSLHVTMISGISSTNSKAKMQNSRNALKFSKDGCDTWGALLPLHLANSPPEPLAAPTRDAV